MKMLLVAAVIALSSLWRLSFAQDCPVQTVPGFLNYGFNLGGCFMCHNEQSQPPSAAELLELCGQTCLADPMCRAFETYPSAALGRLYNLSFGVAVNCCIEHSAVTSFEHPLVGDENSTDRCEQEAACSSTHTWAEDCPRPSPPPPHPSTCMRDPSNLYVHDTEERVWGLRQWMWTGCPLPSEESYAAWESVQCQETDRAPLPGQTLLYATRDSGGDTCSYYEERPQYCGCCDTPLFSAYRDCSACREEAGPANGNATWWTEVFQAWPRKARRLSLEGKGLQGQLPQDFASRWPHLVFIALGNNNLHGPLPNLGTLVNLETLNLEGNQLTGTLPPGLGNLSRLDSLILSGNHLNGTILVELGELSSLRFLRLNDNQLSGEIPAELGKLAALEELALHNNQLTGAIPADLGNLSAWQLRLLYLHNNQLSSAIPAELGKLRALQELRLDKNKLSGRIPGELGGLYWVHELHLLRNQLTGAIPAEFGNLENLVVLDCLYNQLSGSIPPELGRLRKLRSLHLGANQLNGSIPKELGQLSALNILTLFGNRLSGSIPAEFGQLRSLLVLVLMNNQLSGSIPAELGHIPLLNRLELGQNRLSGTIPASFGNFFILQRLSLEDNHLSGRIPPELGKLSELNVLWLQHNRFSGSLPHALGLLTKLVTLDVYDNQLEGGLPGSFRGLSNLDTLHASHNPRLCGTLSSLSDLRRLRTLRLRGCCFEDTHISRPPAGLEYLDLGGNKLTALPETLRVGLTAVKTLLLDHNSIASWDTSSVVPLSQFDEDGVAKCGFVPASEPLKWLKLEVLDVSANFLDPLAYDFLASLSHLPRLTLLRAADNRLSGAVPALVSRGQHDFVLNLPNTQNCTASAATAATGTSAVRESFDLPPAFPALVTLDLARNNITAMLSAPAQQLQQVDLSGNQLTAAGLSDRWWGGGATVQVVNMQDNPSLRLPIRLDPASGCGPASGVLSNLTANAQDWRRVGADNECTTLCPRQALLWIDFTVQEEVLCRCSAGRGVGLNCTACPANTHSVQSFDKEAERYVRTCRECPAHSELRGAAAQCFADCSCGEGHYMQKVVNGSATEVGSASCSFLRAEAQQNGYGEENLLGECRSCGIWRTSKAGSRTLASCLCNGNASNGGWLGLLQEGTACRCPDGERIDFAQRSCVQCDLAEDCTDWSKLLKPPKVKEGFWALPPPLEGEDGLYGNFSGHSIWRCDSSEACPGHFGACGWNRIGTACSLCRRGFFRTPSGSCSRCPQTYTQTRFTLLAALAACMIFPLVAHGLLSADTNSRGLVMTLRSFRISLKQLVKFAQILGVVSLFQVQWPAIVLSLFEVFRLLSFDFASWAGVACLAADQQQTVALELSFRWMLPVLGAAVTALSALLATSCGLLCARRRTGTRLRRLLTFRFWDILRVLLFFLQLFYPSILNNAVLPLTCSPSPNGHLTMNFFPHLICFDLKHDAGFWPLALVGCVFTGLLIVGYPFLIFRLWRLAKVGSMVRAAEDRWWSFQFEDFRFDGMGYALVVLAKDVLLNLVTVVLPGLGTAQLLLTAVVSIGYAWLVHNAMPYEDSSNTLMEVCTSAAVAALCIFSAGMGFQSEPEVLDISSYLLEGRENPVYLQRAFTLICLQGLSLLAPAVIISYQVLSAFGRTRRCIPRSLLPTTDEQRETWRRNFDLAPFFVDQLDDVALRTLHRTVMSSTAAKHSLRQASSRDMVEEQQSQQQQQQQQQQSQATAKPREEPPAAVEREVVEI